jgi:serine/threonine protein kinase
VRVGALAARDHERLARAKFARLARLERERVTRKMSDPLIGSVIAGHRIERLVGRGGMGVVYDAVDIALDRRVALKLIAPEFAAQPGFRRRFMTESKVAAAIDHPNVVPIFRAGEEGDVLFLAMRFVDGDNLRAIVEHAGPLAAERAAAMIAQVAAALDAAHTRGLVHRDVKPATCSSRPRTTAI